MAKWEERNQQLQEDFRGLENKAIDAGFSRESLEEPGASAFSELASVAQALDISEAEKKQKVPGEIERLRKALGSKRKATAVSGELATLELRKKELGQWGKTARTLLGNFTKHDQKLLAESIKGEMVLSSLNAAIAKKEAKTSKTRVGGRSCRKNKVSSAPAIITCWRIPRAKPARCARVPSKPRNSFQK